MRLKSLSGTDLFGITASTVCAIHCLLAPVAIAFLPAYAGDIWESPLVHQLCAGAVAVFCLLAAYQGYRKHNDWVPLTPFAVGLLFVFTATFFLPENVHELYETPILCLGSLALVTGHIWNMRRLGRCCENGEPECTLQIANAVQTPAVLQIEAGEPHLHQQDASATQDRCNEF